MRALLYLGLALAVTGQAIAAEPERSAMVMAPLSFMQKGCKDYGSPGCLIKPETLKKFDNLLQEAEKAGVMAVSVDIWWRLVDPKGTGELNWDYYDQIFDRIRAKKTLRIAPILSFHRCGNGPNDECDFPIPDWIWTRFQPGLDIKELHYESETGKKLDVALPPWVAANPQVREGMTRFIAGFREHYKCRAADFVEINISLGPNGELRYPSYEKSDGWAYPDRGNFQAYSRLAQEAFRKWALEDRDLKALNDRWGLSMKDDGEIRPPNGEYPGGDGALRRANDFVGNKDYDRPYGQDFIDWYNFTLVKHGRDLLLAADKKLDGPMKSVPLGMKIPGIHWQIACTGAPRIAEIAAGLLQTSLKGDIAVKKGAYGYKAIFDMVKDVQKEAGRPVNLHFTALEMTNASCPSSDSSHGTSRPEDLVQWIAESGEEWQLNYRGENASCFQSWDKVYAAFHKGYQGFNLLRLVDAEFFTLTGFNADCKEPWMPVKEGYKTFIDTCITKACRH
ncbi:MAG: family 14 glycosylhydrolase [Rhodoferax sp.]|nr:family 14 glycosylhydrolase [Rhodoferax sp.]